MKEYPVAARAARRHDMKSASVEPQSERETGASNRPGQELASCWHTDPIDAVMLRLDADQGGLTDGEAKQRLRDYGPNRLPETPPPTLVEITLRQFRSPLIYVLGVAAAVSLALGEVKDAAFICGVLVINAIIGTIQEARAEKASQALRHLLTTRAAVKRDGQVRELNADLLVPGDVVLLESGNRVPADARLLGAHGLEVDESLLTGESLPVLKDPRWRGTQDTPLADRRNMVHAGSMVSRGRAQAIVVATGIHSAIGSLALDILAPESGKPPLVYRMEQFTRLIAISILSAAAIVATLGSILGGYTLTEMFLFGVALAVSAIPEGLPVALTVALAIGTTRMARRGVIVRRLTAVEGLGSCTLIASDKTGTLTCNELTVREVRLPDGATYQVAGEGFVPKGRFLRDGQPIEPDEGSRLADLARAVVLCNEADLHHVDNSWILWWWNMHDLERRMMLKVDEQRRTTQYLRYRQSGLSKGEAGARVRTYYPTYGDPDDLPEASPEDNHLPPELKRRIDRYVQKRLEIDGDSLMKEMEASTTFNALVRKEIKNGKL